MIEASTHVGTMTQKLLATADITFYIDKDDSLGTADVGMTQAVVMKLVDPIKGRGHHVYMDNYYTSPQLFSDLHDNGFGACGTVQVNCRGLPAAMKEHEKG